MLAASAGPVPDVRLCRVSATGNPCASSTSRAAGRACRPCGLSIVNSVVTRSSDRSRWLRPRGLHWRLGRRPDLRLLRPQRALGLAAHAVRSGTAAGGHHGQDQTLDQRRGGEPDSVPQRGIDKFERKLGGQDGAAQVHQHDDAVVIGCLDGGGDRGRIGAKGVLVQAGGDLDPDLRTRRHLCRQPHGSVGQSPAVRHHHDSSHPGPPLSRGCGRPWRSAAQSRSRRDPGVRCCARRGRTPAPCAPASESCCRDPCRLPATPPPEPL